MQVLQISNLGIEMPASPIHKLAPLVYAAKDRGIKISSTEYWIVGFVNFLECTEGV